MKHSLLLLILVWLAPYAAHATDAHAVIFMYHRFGEDRYPTTSVRLAQFEAHLEHLAQNGYQVWPLERIVRHLQAGTAIPDRTVAITVDDAYLSVYHEAWPRLKARGWPFTVFVNTDPVDKKLAGFMNWGQMREMARAGVRFANHGASHDSMVERKAGENETDWAARMRADITQGQQRLQQELGTDTNSEPKLFAYPYGEYDEAAANLVQSMGYTAFGQQSGAVGALTDWRSLPRYPMAEAYADTQQFAQKAASLPLPLIDVQPWDPLITANNPPRLELTLERKLAGLNCYTSQGTPLEVRWISPQPPRIEVLSRERLPAGRARYNCTAPSELSGRWYWYSHPWLIPRVTAPASPAPADRGR